MKLWRIIVNGYPYKSIEELGCSNKQEAFTATKQAIYCYIHGNNPNDYEAIGESGKRTLNALKNIYTNSNNCQEYQSSNNVVINKENDEFKIDNINQNCVSKIYSIKTGINVTNYKVLLESNSTAIQEGIEVTDLNNNVKEEFAQKEKFKVLIPIKNLIDKNNFIINIKTTVNSKPILFGKAEDQSYQDCALTCANYEDAIGKIEDTYNKNETKIKIIKQDEKTKEKLEGVEFNILNEKKEIVYANLKTDSNGEIQIQNVIPGKYFIQETNAKDGYIINNELIEIQTELNQELIININNKYEEKIEMKKEKKELNENIVKKLPVTGM